MAGTERSAKADPPERASAEGEAWPDSLHGLLDDAPMAAAVLAGNPPVFRFANPRFCALLQRDGVPGLPLHEAIPGAADKALGRWMSEDTPEGDWPELPLSELWGGTPDRFVRVHLRPLPRDAGLPQGLLLMLAEVTLEVRARRALERAHDERKRLLSELKDTRRKHDDFIATLGHALRGALAPIVTTLDLLQLSGPETSAARLATLVRNTRKLAELANSMLLAASGDTSTPQPLQVAALLQRAAANVHGLMQARRHELVLRLDDERLTCEGDEERLLQVLGHLLHNAARFTPPGGRIELGAQRRQGQLQLTVRDNGIGMSPQTLPLVWTPFFQGPAPEGTPAGIGMGLSVVQSLVALHGGTVTAFSEGPGLGSEFTVRLPLQRSDREAATPPPPAASGPLRVLVVDDNEDGAESLAGLLRTLGHEVTVSIDPLHALALVDGFRPQLALLDLHMPHMDGWQLARQLRRRPWGGQCRLVALSAHSHDNDRQRSAQAGFEQHLVKPVTLAVLLRVLAQRDSAPA